ncbi:MAG: T9SS type A sorting domain-containing protein [Saprospiraceae bacterium]
MKHFFLVILILCCSVLSSQNLILNPSFEQKGEPNCEHWYIGCCIPLKDHCDTTLSAYGVTMIHVVPPDSFLGSWNVQLYGTFPDNTSIVTYIPAIKGTYVYQLKFWMNSFHFGGGGGINLQGNQIEETKWIRDWGKPWTQYSLLDTITAGPEDTLEVILSADIGDFCLCDVYFDQIEISVIDSFPTAVHDPSNEFSFTISPNPVVNYLQVRTTELNSFSFNMYDTTGKKVLHQTSDSEQLVIDCSGLAPGIYFYEINVDGGKARVGKIIKTYD